MNNDVNNQTQMTNNLNNGYQQPVQNFQQPMQQPIPKKKKNIALIIGLSIVGVFVLGIVAFFALFTISEKKATLWQSGAVEILGKNIQLPCKIEEFESILNTKIQPDDIFDGIVELNTGFNSKLKFDVDIEDNMVVGLNMSIYSDVVAAWDKDNLTNERNVAKKVVFPGNVTIDMSMNEIKKLYKSTPINVYFNVSDEVIEEMTEENDGWLSTNYRWHDDEWEVAIHTKTNIRTNVEEITEFNYWYIKD